MYQPMFKGPIEGYVVNFLAKNLWRVKRTHEHDDAMQEAYLIFMRCCDRYPNMDTPQHFMSLFMRSWNNHFTDLSNKATKARAIVSQHLQDSDGESYCVEQVGELDNAGMLQTMLRQAPREVVMVVNLFMNAPQELLDLATRTWEESGQQRGTESAHVAKMLGLPVGSNPLQATRDYFDGGNITTH